MDFFAYRRWEALALESELSWMSRRAHYPQTFEQAGFPVWLDSIEDTKLLLTSHSGRWKDFLAELGGLNDIDIKIIKECVKKFVAFYNSMFTYKKLVVPIEDIIQQYIVYNACSRILDVVSIDKPNVLEIGPGLGMQTLMLPIYNNQLTYSQLEVTPSLYIVQHWLSKLTHQNKFIEEANPTQNPTLASNSSKHMGSIVDNNFSTNISTGDYPVTHYPWWKVKQSFEANGKLDLVISNDNLFEMNPLAVNQYVKSAYESLSDDGFFFVNSFGSSKTFHQNHQSIKKIFLDAGFVTLLHLPRLAKLKSSNSNQVLAFEKAVFVKNTSSIGQNSLQDPVKLQDYFAWKLFGRKERGQDLDVKDLLQNM